MGKIKQNLVYQITYQFLTIILPLATSPYLSRVLGAEKLGIFSFSNSVVNYFTLFAALGVMNYGTRTIAECIDDKEKRTRCFCEIYLLQLFSSLLALLAYITYIFLFCKENQLVAFVFIGSLLSVFLDINWFYFGIENFRLTVNRNIVIKLLSIISIFLFVKSANDLWIYTLIIVGSSSVSNGLLFFFLPKYIELKKITKYVQVKNCLKHIKPNLLLFIPLLAMTVYHLMDKVMLGLMSDYVQSGYYYNSDKIVNTPVGFIHAFCNVMLPRIVATSECNCEDNKNTLFFLSLKGIGFATSAIAFGIAGIAPVFVPLFFGNEFSDCSMLITVLAPVLIIKGYCYVARMLYLIPQKKERIYILSVVVGAAINLVLNYILIPLYHALGAVIGTLGAEFFSCLIQYIVMSKYICFKKTLFQSFVFLFIGFLMFVVVRFLESFLFCSVFIKLSAEICIGAVVYLLLSIAYSKKIGFIDIKK